MKNNRKIIQWALFVFTMIIVSVTSVGAYSYFTFGIVIAFFVTGVIGAKIIASTLEIETVKTYSFIPFLVFLPFAITHGILVGSVGYETENKKLSNQKTKWTIFAFVTVFSLITFI